MKEPSFDVVYDFANLYAAYRAARKGKRWKNSVAKVESNALEAVARLQVELQEGFYRPGDYHEFFVFEPKDGSSRRTASRIKSSNTPFATKSYTLCYPGPLSWTITVAKSGRALTLALTVWPTSCGSITARTEAPTAGY